MRVRVLGFTLFVFAVVAPASALSTTLRESPTAADGSYDSEFALTTASHDGETSLLDGVLGLGGSLSTEPGVFSAVSARGSVAPIPDAAISTLAAALGGLALVGRGRRKAPR